MLRFLKKNVPFLRFVVTLAAASLPVFLFHFFSLGASPSTITGKVDYAIRLIERNDLLMRIYLVVLATCAITYMFYYFFEQKKPPIVKVFSGDREYIKFCRLRRDVIESIHPKDFKDPIYATSHCNMFRYPDCVDEEYKQRALQINKEYFFTLMRKLSVHNDQTKLNLMIYYEDSFSGKEDIRVEWETRAEIITQSGAGNQSDISPKRLLRKLLTDYLVVEDHVFVTKRKPNSGSSPVSCMYIRDEVVAQSYRNWLRDLSDSKNGEYVAEDALLNNVFEQTIENDYPKTL